MREIEIITATFEDDPEIGKIASQSKYTRDFNRLWFIRTNILNHYSKGHVGKAIVGRRIVGFVLVNHLKRKPHSSIYYMGVDRDVKREGVGRQLVSWALSASPWNKLQLVCEDSNVEGMKFYLSLGFIAAQEGLMGATKKSFKRLELEKSDSQPERN